MNIENNHLVKLSEANALPDGYQPIPTELTAAALAALAGKSQVFVSKRSGGKLSKWAAQQRKQKRKAAAESKKRNRRK